MKRATGKSNIDIVKDYLSGERPFVQVGYTGDRDKYRKEGEKWTDTKGIEWQRKDGKNIRLTKTQGDIIREAIGDSQSCKKCGLQMKWGSRKDEKLMRRTGLCVECLTDYETQLRILGIFDQYEQYHLASHELGFLKEARERIKETLAYFEETGGDVIKLAETEYDEEIRWKNTNKDKIVADATEDLKKVEALIATGSLVTEGLKKQYEELVAKYELEAYA